MCFMSVLSACMCTTCVPDACRSQKRAGTGATDGSKPHVCWELNPGALNH